MAEKTPLLREQELIASVSVTMDYCLLLSELGGTDECVGWFFLLSAIEQPPNFTELQNNWESWVSHAPSLLYVQGHTSRTDSGKVSPMESCAHQARWRWVEIPAGRSREAN